MKTSTSIKRRYSEAEQAQAIAALDSNGGDIAKTHYETGVPRNTLRDWRDQRRRPIAPEVREREKDALARSCDRLALRMLRQANRKVKDMGGAAATLSACQLIDKARLIRGEATAITQHQSDARIEALEAVYGKLRAAIPITDATTIPAKLTEQPLPCHQPASVEQDPF